jgi:hypothetical protein
MEVSGKVKLVNATQVVSDKFSKRTLVVVTNDQYPQEIEVQFTQDKCSMLDGLSVGAEVTIGVNLRGRMWTNPQGEEKYFNTIEGWKIDKVGIQQSTHSAQPTVEVEDGMPF